MTVRVAELEVTVPLIGCPVPFPSSPVFAASGSVMAPKGGAPFGPARPLGMAAVALDAGVQVLVGA